ncbi:MAG: NAD(P)/FAD-dependent oxidoreductase [Chamaesiphon sp.]|nr:NAD(P)/FAD-dependent oxidoreductase [Chamaesiphon sp.]
MQYDAVIIGAGLAGCSAAIQMAATGVRVLLLEQSRYPVHKLCGEFLSVEVTAAFERLGILESVQTAGASSIRRAYLTTKNGKSFHHPLPGTALGLSRYRLDAILFERSIQMGAECRDGVTVKSVTGNLQTGFEVVTSQGIFTSRTVLGAYGKKSALSSQLKRSPFVAFKAHYTGVQVSDAIELHAFDGGYCGLSAIESGQVNLCWIGHERILQGNRSLPPGLYTNPVLADRLSTMQRVPGSLHGLSQISLAIKPKFQQDVCQIGDTAGMIMPLCGDGMAMALRSTELAIPLALAFLDGKLSAPEFKYCYAVAWNREFWRRLRVGKLMHDAFIHPSVADWGVDLCDRLPAIGAWIIQATRGRATLTLD